MIQALMDLESSVVLITALLAVAAYTLVVAGVSIIRGLMMRDMATSAEAFTLIATLVMIAVSVFFIHLM